MATIADIRSAGTELLFPQREITEPLNAPESFITKLGRFGDSYDLSTSSHLYRFLVALCGDAGAGSLKKELLYPKLQTLLESTQFNDLDKLYGNPLALPRLSQEIYTVDPKNEMLTYDQWREVYIKDADYRARCLLWMRAIAAGPTLQGIALAAEAATGIQCDVFERYKYLENQNSDLPITVDDIGNTTSINEFVIIPRTTSLSPQEQRRIGHLVDRIRPVNTIFSTVILDDPRTERAIREIASSSSNFRVRRLVTGSPNIIWPSVDLSQGFWIEAGVEKEAPTFAFYNKQEAITYLSIGRAIASSEHIGPFNATQRNLFTHLNSIEEVKVYDESFSFAKAFAPIEVSTTWLRETDKSKSLVNDYYPLEYFADIQIEQLSSGNPTDFWASEEKFAPEVDTLILDLQTIRPINFIDFEIGQKPINFTFEHANTNTSTTVWTELNYSEEFEPQNAMAYIPSVDSSWGYVENHFTLTTARYLKITFTRRPENFPFIDSEPFAWSIDIRNLRIANVIAQVEDFITDSGTDILGNSYLTDLIEYTPDNILSTDQLDYWQSQPNPVPEAVESLYFDLRINSTPGTMSFLDVSDRLGNLDTSSMSSLEVFVSDGVVIDEIFIDPITLGANMHFYYSNDHNADWDSKLWIPIAQNYVLKKGFHALPQPIYARYFKIEFSNLIALPYNSLDYPRTPLIKYRKFPTWVQDHFKTIFDTQRVITGKFDSPYDIVSIEPLTFGFITSPDNLDSTFKTIRTLTQIENTDEIQDFIASVTSTTTSTDIVQQESEAQVNFFPSFMYQQDLLDQLDVTRALSRYIQNTETNINAEVPATVDPAPSVQSIPDLSTETERKSLPSMFFPRRCRHGYQVIRANRPTKVAYYVAIKDVSFHRRDFTVPYDEHIYVESLGDTSHTYINEFQQDDWRFVITP